MAPRIHWSVTPPWILPTPEIYLSTSESISTHYSSAYLGMIKERLKKKLDILKRNKRPFFSLFEHVADGEKSPPCIFTGRAQQTYLSLSSSDFQKYCAVKSAVLKVYELVPEAYRDSESGRKMKEVHLELADNLTAHFSCWMSVLLIHCAS